MIAPESDAPKDRSATHSLISVVIRFFIVSLCERTRERERVRVRGRGVTHAVETTMMTDAISVALNRSRISRVAYGMTGIFVRCWLRSQPRAASLINVRVLILRYAFASLTKVAAAQPAIETNASITFISGETNS